MNASDIKTFEPAIIFICGGHTDGNNDRSCPWASEYELYSQDTYTGVATVNNR